MQLPLRVLRAAEDTALDTTPPLAQLRQRLEAATGFLLRHRQSLPLWHSRDRLARRQREKHGRTTRDRLPLTGECP